MRIVNLEEFEKLPSGTVYSKYEDCVFYGFMLKGETYEYDFTYADLIGNVECNDSDDYSIKCELMKKGASLPTEIIYERDGLFIKEQLFAVYEREDIDRLIKALKEVEG